MEIVRLGVNQHGLQALQVSAKPLVILAYPGCQLAAQLGYGRWWNRYRVVVTGESNAAQHNGSTRVLAERRYAVWLSVGYVPKWHTIIGRRRPNKMVCVFDTLERVVAAWVWLATRRTDPQGKGGAMHLGERIALRE